MSPSDSGRDRDRQLDASASRRLFTTSDGIDRDSYVLVHYRMASQRNADELRDAIVRMALVASVGTVSPVASETTRTREEYGPRILYPLRSTHGQTAEATIAIPVALFGHRDVLTQIMAVSMFAAEYNYVDDIHLHAIDLPRCLLDQIAGPALGLDGIRAQLRVQKGPILGAILKPRLGISAKLLILSAREALQGGIDVILDDELVVDPQGELSFDQRVAALVDAARQASEASGEEKGFVANISSRPTHAVEYATRAISLGARGLIFNAFICGFPALSDLVALDLGVPIYACNVGSGFLTRSGDPTGISSSVYCRLSRLAGADAVQTGISAGDAYTTEAWGPSVIALDGLLGRIRRSMPIVAGGLNLANLWTNWHALGDDALFASGSGVFGYPGGPRNGGVAFRRVIDSLSADMSPQEADEGLVRLASGRDRVIADGLTAYGYKPQ